MLEKTLESLLDCKEIKPVNPNIQSSPEYSLEGLMLKLKLQYFGHPMRRADSLEKTLMLGKIEGKRRGRQRMRRLDSIADSKDMSLSKLGDGEGQGSWCAAVQGDKLRSGLDVPYSLTQRAFCLVMTCTHDASGEMEQLC